ncbi:MAG: patatin-like phospholipase family protein [Elusimicrobia bacterium]|nr:patatin-like phospholipase family protein [Elusimicrobiota bacterium]
MRRASAVLLSIYLATAPAAALDLSDDGLLRDHLWRQLTAKPKGERPVVGLVFSAGSLRAAAHVGVITVLENAGFPVDVVAGTSMGAIVGALYAAGKPIKRLWELALGLRISSGSNYNAFNLLRLLLFDRLLSSKNTEKFIRDEIGSRSFEELKKPFACVAMDLYSGEGIIFREGELAPAVRASMNLPGIFAPVEYRHRYLVDGGVVNYIPIDAAKLLGADWVLASVTETDYTYSKPQNVLQSLEQVIDIRGTLLAREQKKSANFLIEPPVGDIGFYDTSRSYEAIAKGVMAAHRRIGAAMEEYILFSLDCLLKDYIP